MDGALWQTKEMAASIAAAALAIIGSIIAAWIVARATREATLSGIREQAEIGRRRDEEQLNEDRRRLAFSIQAELIALRDRWVETFEPLLAQYQHGQAAPFVAASFEYFTVFDSNTDRLGLFEPAHATALVRLYVRMKGYLDGLKSFLEDERCKASRQQAVVAPGVYDFIRDEIDRLHDEGQGLVGPCAEAVAFLDTYLAAPALPPPAAEERIRMTRLGWLASVIALVTALAALLTASNTYRQVALLESQVAYHSAETRPFFRLKPRILSSSKNSMLVSANVVNVGRIPGRVVGYDVLVQLGRDIIPPKGNGLNVLDVLYPSEPGVGITARLPAAEAQRWARGEPLIVGACLIYGGLPVDDRRRWRVFGAYKFGVGEDLPTLLFMDEEGVASDSMTCSASGLREEWEKRLRLVPKN